MIGDGRTTALIAHHDSFDWLGLGTAVSVDRPRAKDVGFVLHFAVGLLCAMLYDACFVAINRSEWRIGAGFGVFHALFAGTTLVTILLPFVHPRMGTPTTARLLFWSPMVHAVELWSQYASRDSCR